MPPVGFDPTISAGERPKTYALDSAATGTGSNTGLRLGNSRELILFYFLITGQNIRIPVTELITT